MSQDINIPSRSATGYRYRIRRVTLLLSLPICVFLNACDGGPHKAVQGLRGRPTVVAEPNRVPAGDLDQPVGSTVITGNTGTGVVGTVYVQVNCSAEVSLGRGAAGT